MAYRYVYEDGTVLDIDEDIDPEDLPEGEDDISDESFAAMVAEAEAAEAAEGPDESEVETSPDGSDGDAG